MTSDRNFEILDAALRRCRASWDAAQAHGFISARLSVAGAGAVPDTVARILDECDTSDAARGECAMLLMAELEATSRELDERESGFTPLLPDDDEPAARRADALAHWCEGFLHGLVSGEEAQHGDLKERLAAEPFADIIVDMLQMTRAVTDDDGNDDEEEAYAEIVEYLRVVTQLVYEELADLRPAVGR
jgi:uncharacterized protein YgfB (UPF0149 family)